MGEQKDDELIDVNCETVRKMPWLKGHWNLTLKKQREQDKLNLRRQEQVFAL